MRKIMISIIVCVAFAGACSKSSTVPSFTPDCTGTAKSFSRDVLPVFQSSCNGCHSFSTYSQIAGDKSAIRSRIVDGSMPQSGSLTNVQKNNVVCWIDNGALNN